MTKTTALSRLAGLGAGCLLLAGFASCAGPAQFVERFAPDFSSARHTVSILGVYKDGQVSPEAWDTLAPYLAPRLGAPSCPVACDARLASTERALYGAIDDYARANGPDDALLAELAPAARGDLVMVVVEGGRLPTPEKVSVVDSPPASANANRGGGFSVFDSGKRRKGAEEDVLVLSAALFSVTLGRSVGVVELHYSGSSSEQAMKSFAERISRALPEAHCDGWAFGPAVSAERIRSAAGL